MQSPRVPRGAPAVSAPIQRTDTHCCEAPLPNKCRFHRLGDRRPEVRRKRAAVALTPAFAPGAGTWSRVIDTIALDDLGAFKSTAGGFRIALGKRATSLLPLANLGTRPARGTGPASVTPTVARSNAWGISTMGAAILRPGPWPITGRL